jgi:hypothetical protein
VAYPDGLRALRPLNLSDPTAHSEIQNLFVRRLRLTVGGQVEYGAYTFAQITATQVSTAHR